eukprot:m.211289 g.211289  ORF g.211289 m.211289 type:complete len:371 (+) comp25433_c0_seq1:184-1296(+)
MNLEKGLTPSPLKLSRPSSSHNVLSSLRRQGGGASFAAMLVTVAVMLCLGAVVYDVSHPRELSGRRNIPVEVRRRVMLQKPRPGPETDVLSSRFEDARDASGMQRPLVPMKQGLIVVVAGLQRSGSTALYNLARLLMSDQDPNLVMFYLTLDPDKTFANETHIQQCRDNNVSVLIKLHSPEMLARLIALDLVDVLLSSHRSPVEMLCSNAILFGPDWHKYADTGWARMCENRLETQDQIYQTAATRHGKRPNTPESGIDYDMEFFPPDTVEVLAKVASLLGISGVPRSALQHMADAFSRITDVLPEKWLIPGWVHHPITMMHAAHASASRTEKQACIQRVYNATRLSQPCMDWQARNGAYQINLKVATQQ